MKELINEQLITNTIESNYMPYAMSVIVSRAIPEIDGFKPSHRKLLFTMYKMGLLGGARTKSANVVGQTMKLNPHGDAAIYETMVRLTRGYESLLHPFVDSKGSFGKIYSRDMAYAASRYTEVKLDSICSLMFTDIDKDTVDFVDNYDSTIKEPTLLPTAFPNILVSPNQGIAVGMACSICSFNLKEICDTTIKLLNNEKHDLLETLLAPDFSTGGQLIYDRSALEEIYKTGRGSFKVRAKYIYDKKNNCIEIIKLPYTTTVEAVMDKLIEHVKLGRLRDIVDIRDETDLNGLKLVIDLKRGVDADLLMQKLFSITPLEDTFSCNFNLLIGGSPMVLGVREILNEWIAFRVECIKRRVHFDMQRKKERLHLLRGLKKILLDIDKAVKIVRDTDEDSEVVPNLMIGFGIDEKQAEFIAEIKLRNLNKQYIINALSDVEKLEAEILNLEEILKDRKKVEKIIIKELEDTSKRFGRDRETQIIYQNDIVEYNEEHHIEDYAVNLFLTKEGYFKKITPLSLRMGGEQRLKDGDFIAQSFEATNKTELLFFTSACQVYKTKAYEFDDQKASILGDYIPVKLGMDPGEIPIFMAATTDYKGFILIFFNNGRVAKVDLQSFATKTNRKKLTGGFCSKFPVVFFDCMTEDADYAMFSTLGKIVVFNSANVPRKTARDTQGVIIMTLKGKNMVERVQRAEQSGIKNPNIYKVKNLPAAGKTPQKEDADIDQVKL